MAYYHGVKTSEVATSVITPVSTTAGLPVVFGTAPVHLTSDPTAYVNKPVICYSYSEAVKALGYSADWEKYTLCEAIYSQFQLYAVSPIVFVNVLDPSTHKKTTKDSELTVTDKTAAISAAVLLDTLKVASTAGGDAATLGTDYTAAYNDDEQVVITVLDDGALKSATSVFVTYDEVDASAVTGEDIIGGTDSAGNITGLELINSIYSYLSLVPGMIAAPGWSQNSEVAAVMKSKALTINNLFRCIVLTDIDTTAVKTYSDANVWKNKNNYTGTNQVVCWPCYTMGGKVYHASTHMMGVIGVMDADNDDVPYQSPSNRTAQITGMCLADGTEVILTLEQANLLNSQGICTALNFNGGWKLWGNYTGAYPSNTDVKDSFICVRRMFDWNAQTFILTYWQKVDQPLTKRLVKSITDSEKIRLNGLVSRGYLLGADVEFLDDENPTTDLLQGIIRVHTYMTPPVPAQEIEDIMEYDVDNFSALFE